MADLATWYLEDLGGLSNQKEEKKEENILTLSNRTEESLCVYTSVLSQPVIEEEPN